MTRTKLKLGVIPSESTRKLTLKRRRANLFKKTEELSVLCDVEAGIIVYSPEEETPAVFPSLEAVAGMVARFKSLPEMERSKKAVTNEGYLRDRAASEGGKVRSEEERNDEKEMQVIMNQLIGGMDLSELDERQLNGMFGYAARRLKRLEVRDRELERLDPPPPPPPPPPQSEAEVVADRAQGGSSGGGDVVDRWFVGDELPDDLNQSWPHIFSP